MVSREPSGSVSPGEQAPRDDADLRAAFEQPEHEVVVLRPAALAIAELAKPLAPQHQRGVRDGTLDERLLAHAQRRIDRAQPAGVGAHAGSDLLAREEPRVAADRGERGRRLQRPRLRGEPLAVHHVVGIHARDQQSRGTPRARRSARRSGPGGAGRGRGRAGRGRRRRARSRGSHRSSRRRRARTPSPSRSGAAGSRGRPAAWPPRSRRGAARRCAALSPASARGAARRLLGYRAVEIRALRESDLEQAWALDQDAFHVPAERKPHFLRVRDARALDRRVRRRPAGRGDRRPRLRPVLRRALGADGGRAFGFGRAGAPRPGTRARGDAAAAARDARARRGDLEPVSGDDAVSTAGSATSSPGAISGAASRRAACSGSSVRRASASAPAAPPISSGCAPATRGLPPRRTGRSIARSSGGAGRSRSGTSAASSSPRESRARSKASSSTGSSTATGPRSAGRSGSRSTSSRRSRATPRSRSGACSAPGRRRRRRSSTAGLPRIRCCCCCPSRRSRCWPRSAG